MEKSACQLVHHFSTTVEWIDTTFCTHVHGPQRKNPSDCGDPNFSPSTTGRLTLFNYVLTTYGWIAMKFGIYIHFAQMMSPNDFGDSLNFLVPPSAGES